jgi:hypothetical protein
MKLSLHFVPLGLILFSILYFRLELEWYISLGIGLLLSSIGTALVHFNKTFECVLQLSLVRIKKMISVKIFLKH